MARAWTTATLGLGVTLGACDGATGASDVLCTTPVELSVTVGGAPRAAWTPGCLVQQVEVFEAIAPSAGGPQTRWAFVAPRGGFAPPITYGQVPVGADVGLQAVPLVVGHTYLVRLSMTELVGSSSVVGEAAFTR